ncbi:MAG: histidinol dehydrogenase [Gammaproteobacteria bacterium]|nr:histidinol dehydrogenase [Gammaproteobacteria bacterium]
MTPMRTIDSRAEGFGAELDRLLGASPGQDAELDRSVAAILADVRARGDAALIEYTNRFDRNNLAAGELEVPAERLAAAAGSIDRGLREALEQAARRIRRYHQRQRQESWSYDDGEGVELGQKMTPLDRVGVYVPGGRAAYPSSVLMNVIPAQVAGVGEIIMVSPAMDGQPNPAVLAAAQLADVRRVFSIGGAQAIAALAFGTETVPAVDKIVGPGNRYVAAAKRLVFGVVGIDMIAGPSEVVVVSDGTTPAEWIALDLFAQAEHDEDARAILLCTDAEFAEKVKAAIDRLLPEMDRAQTIRASLSGNGAIVRVRDLDEAVAIVNRMAPEHLELAVADPRALLERVRNAGAIFLGCHAAEVLGDYCAGPNHVLPTGRSARFSSPLGVYDFQKRSSVIACTAGGAAKLAGTASVLARAEGLTAHAQSAECRMRRN